MVRDVFADLSLELILTVVGKRFLFKFFTTLLQYSHFSIVLLNHFLGFLEAVAILLLNMFHL